MDASFHGSVELRLKSHKPEELVSVAIENSRNIGSKLTTHQIDAIERYQSFPWNEGASESFMVEEFFHIFDGLFFFGLLKGKCRVICREEHNKLWGAMLPAKKTVRIWMLMWDSTPEDQEESVISWASTLLHEMIHAYLYLFMLPKKMRTHKFEAGGRTGHGSAWQDIAYVLEKRTNSSDLIKLPDDLDLHREHSLELELKRWRNKPTIDRKRWELEPRTTWTDQEIRRVINMVFALESVIFLIGFKYFRFGGVEWWSKCLST